MRKLTIKFLHRKLSRITVDEALWLLKVCRANNAEFCLRGETGSVYAATSADLLQYYKWIKSHEPACALLVRFLGGPLPEVSGVPRKYYSGSLVTFVVDRVLSLFASYGVDYSWLLKFDGNSVLPLWVQLKKEYPEGLHTDTSPPRHNMKQLPLFDTIAVQNYTENRVVETAKVGGQLIEMYEDGTQGPPRAAGTNDENYSWQ